MNLNETQSRIRVVTLAVLVGATILLIVLDTTGSLDGVFSFFEDPISGVMGWTSTRTDAIVDTVTGPDDIQDARAQILALQSQVDSLQRENEQLREIEGEFVLGIVFQGGFAMLTIVKPDSPPIIGPKTPTTIWEDVADFIIETYPQIGQEKLEKALDAFFDLGDAANYYRGLSRCSLLAHWGCEINTILAKLNIDDGKVTYFFNVMKS